jgi:hypothetical protein
MERMLNVLGECGMANRIRRREAHGLNGFGAIGLVVLAATATACAWTDRARAQGPPAGSTQQSLLSPSLNDVHRADAARPATTGRVRPRVISEPAAPSGPAAPSIATGSAAELAAHSPQRFKVRDEFGHCVVARLHGQFDGKAALILPDGQLGTTDRLIPTDEPFQPLTADKLQTLLAEGPFADYLILKTDHYLIFYQSTLAFAQDSGRLLEDLYRGLIDTFRRNGIPVHQSEFPLVAVIFATESDFRAHKQVDPQVRAYYEYFTNRIFFFQKSDRDQIEPKVAALLKPQTVAHEGAHQILCNIGVQPRLSSWPAWLVEGLAEYCATTVTSKKGITWNGVAAINSLHMATIRELEDPLSNQINSAVVPTIQVARQRSTIQAEAMMLKSVLTPTDYAQAWALTHYLAQRRGTDFVKLLKAMGQVAPLQPRTPQENLAEFRKFFEGDLTRLDRKVDDYIHKLSQKKTYDSLFYYTVIFQQNLGNGVVRKLAFWSQSPQMIQQRVLELTSPHGDEPIWEAIPRPTRAQAIFTAEEWMRSNN